MSVETDLAHLQTEVAVVKQILTDQVASLIKLRVRVDQLWDGYQQAAGASDSNHRTELWWRWGVGLAITIIVAILGYRIYTHP